MGFSYTNILGKEKIEKITIRLPMLDDKLDIFKQNELVQAYQEVISIKKKIIENLQLLIEGTVTFNLD